MANGNQHSDEMLDLLCHWINTRWTTLIAGRLGMGGGSRKKRMMAQLLWRLRRNGLYEDMIAVAQNTPGTEDQSRRVFRRVVTEILSEVFVLHGHDLRFGGLEIECRPFD